MATNKITCNKILPVAIMAHNEEKVIQKAIDSIFRQDLPNDYSVITIVAANACLDRTEEIIENIQRLYGKRVLLISIRQKARQKHLIRLLAFLRAWWKSIFQSRMSYSWMPTVSLLANLHLLTSLRDSIRIRNSMP
jgi:cellulose synthase/poly-beta-1,6-N-acetylglucosamine synthase-like glycosyltransferase